MSDTPKKFWKKRLGAFGEDLARAYLAREGYELLATNWECDYGELDIVAKLKDTFVIVEVKTVSPGKTESAADTVGKTKQKHIQRCAELFLKDEKSVYNCRFDVIAIEYEKGTEPKLQHIIDAF